MNKHGDIVSIGFVSFIISVGCFGCSEEATVVARSTPNTPQITLIADLPMAKNLGRMRPIPPGPVGPADLVLVQERLEEDMWLDVADFEAHSCAYKEGCITETGTRRLLRFAVTTANMGDGDLHVGRPPLLTDEFHYSECHEHYHRDGFAEYSLHGALGVIVRGHKQAFCLMDSYPISIEAGSQESPVYNCGYQGISPGWADDYGSELDCQWIDVTDVSPGEYVLEVRVNADGSLPENNRSNNVGRVRVTIPEFDLRRSCAEHDATNGRKTCGWSKRAQGVCQAGRWTTVSCIDNTPSTECGDRPFLRACFGDEAPCYPSQALAPSDLSKPGNPCDALEFLCPVDGPFTVWGTPSQMGSRCEARIQFGEVPLTRRCQDNAPLGPERMCGWVHSIAGAPCLPGQTYTVGCAGYDEECGQRTACSGDPMMRVCSNNEACAAQFSLGEGDDACGGKCPQVSVVCPHNGTISVFVGAHDHARTYACEPEIRLQ